jgi:PAB1-binding protein PBP1
MMKFYGGFCTLALALLVALGPAQARSSAGVSRSSSSHSSSHSSGSHSTRSSGGSTRSKTLPAGTHFVRKTCKTASCKAKHPGGSYMLPIKPKKTG